MTLDLGSDEAEEADSEGEESGATGAPPALIAPSQAATRDFRLPFNTGAAEASEEEEVEEEEKEEEEEEEALETGGVDAGAGAGDAADAAEFDAEAELDAVAAGDDAVDGALLPSAAPTLALV